MMASSLFFPGILSASHTLELINHQIATLDRVAAASRAADWRRQFRHWSSSVWRAAAPVLRPGQPPPTFTAADMRADWLPVWCPTHTMPDGAGARSRLAPERSIPKQPCGPPLPTYDSFVTALRSASGSAGFHGWEAQEVKALPSLFTDLCIELYEPWCDTTFSQPTLLDLPCWS